MKLTLVRHAESEGNVRKLIQGHTDYPLTQNGHEQAQRVAKRFAGERFDAIYASDLERASQTAQAIIDKHPESEVVYDERLRERYFGTLEDRSTQELFDNGYTEQQVWGAPEGGEDVETFKQRIFGFLDDLWEEHRGEHVLLVTHSGFITRLVLTLTEAGEDEYRNYKSRNTGVTVIEFDLERNHTLRLLNCCAHLG